jgi:hypothetical protein
MTTVLRQTTWRVTTTEGEAAAAAAAAAAAELRGEEE